MSIEISDTYGADSGYVEIDASAGEISIQVSMKDQDGDFASIALSATEATRLSRALNAAVLLVGT